MLIAGNSFSVSVYCTLLRTTTCAFEMQCEIMAGVYSRNQCKQTVWTGSCTLVVYWKHF